MADDDRGAVTPRRKPRRTRGKPNNVDLHVGGRVRLRRTLLGMSQQTLADGLGITFQQVQKYERGANRIGAGRLYDLSRALAVPVNYFFDQLPGAPQAGAGPVMVPDPLEGLDTRRQYLTLITRYRRIENEKVQRCISDLIRALAE